MYKLIACPICGTRYPILLHDAIEKYFRVICESCKAETDPLPSEDAAVEAWNAGMAEVVW